MNLCRFFGIQESINSIFFRPIFSLPIIHRREIYQFDACLSLGVIGRSGIFFFFLLEMLILNLS